MNQINTPITILGIFIGVAFFVSGLMTVWSYIRFDKVDDKLKVIESTVSEMQRNGVQLRTEIIEKITDQLRTNGKLIREISDMPCKTAK